MLTEQAVPETYTIGEMIRVPVVLRDEDGVCHIRAVFKRMRRPGHRGPRDLDPEVQRVTDAKVCVYLRFSGAACG